MNQLRVTTPLTDESVKNLEIGQKVLLNGIVYTARDAAHKKLVELLNQGKALPIELKGQVIYYVGPSPAPPGKIIGSAGPTTSYRMDTYAPRLMKEGLKGMIGKGARSKEVVEAIKDFRCIYFAAIGGAAALISKSIKKAKVVAYPELGPEAIHCLEVEDLPVIVVNDCQGQDLYQQGVAVYREV